MSEAPSRPARGRTTARGGGRGGGYGSRGARNTNGDGASKTDTSAEQGELAELKKRYSSQLTTLKELFPDWSDADLVLAIEEADGDLERTIERISEGAVSQFSEVPKKAKDRSRSKATKENLAPTDLSAARGIRGDAPRRGLDSSRGRGRGTDRGRGGLRGGRAGATQAPRTASTSVPTNESPAWDTPAAEPGAWDAKPTPDAAAGAWGAKPDTPAEAQKDAVPGTVSEVLHDPKEAIKHPVTAAKKTWASMFAKPAEPTPPKPAPKAAEPPKEPAPAPAEPPAAPVAQDAAVPADTPPSPPPVDDVEEPTIIADDTTAAPEKPAEPVAEATITPSKDELTKENVEHLPDVSHPPPTETAFSTVASSKDVGSAVATPLSTSGQAPIGRPAVGGFATTALKATAGTPNRSASFQRRLQEQQEAVVMPGNHAVDRAAVQFGSLGLGGEEDVDEDREEAETRTQPPQHSPVAQPRASLPPAPRQAPNVEQSEPEQAVPTPKPAPGLPPVPQQQQQQQQQQQPQPLSQQSPSNPLASQAMQNQGSQSSQPYNQFGRYNQQSESAAAPSQKPYDPFGQQIPSSSNQYDYPGQQSQAQSQPGAFSSAPDNYSSHYLTSEQQRNAYQQYYQNYGQQTPSQQEAGSAQQRTGSGFGSGPQDSFSQGQQTRYGEASNSGHNTPNPGAASQLPSGPASQGQHQGHSQQSQHGGYPYNHPYYGSPYYANYMNQFGGYGQQQGYGSFGKGMYGQPHHYGMSPQASYDQHSSSPANAGGFGASSNERGSGFGGLGDYGRSASGMGQNHSATSGSAGFGGLPDAFSRPGYAGQGSYGQQQSGQQAGDDSLKGFGDSKSTGPSQSALGAQQGRPGSATQGTPSQSAQGLHQQQSHQQGFGGYPSHLGGNSQYGGLGGLGHQQGGNQQSGYGNYGGFGGGYGGGNYNSRGGWGTNYGQH
ncbi:hypothetical protein C7974DRAFT_43746 [Boeremia exigua]|uniref:uncharacterized protein n=1 Tax=Boeremia exigua TaxID=749465 RepID=UPI001E8D0FBC|nr:uncharacterized protein C7974DRAFT_43746 [Boeremia exigua]KAH6616371.1 hypothetical protein C7974DRAFT_43746 [Boeremia exigua]